MAEAIPAQKEPYQFRVQAGRNYFWCACGRSKKQPICDGSHSGTGLTPVIYEAKETKDEFVNDVKKIGNDVAKETRSAAGLDESEDKMS